MIAIPIIWIIGAIVTAEVSHSKNECWNSGNMVMDYCMCFLAWPFITLMELTWDRK